MLPVSFILAALLAADGVVLAHPINYARRNELPSIVPRAVPDSNPVALTQGHVGPRNWLGIRGYDVDGVETRGLSDLEDLELEIRGFVGEGKKKKERRELDDEFTTLMARDATGSDGVVLVPRREVHPDDLPDANDSGPPTPSSEPATPDSSEHGDPPPPYHAPEAPETPNGSEQTATEKGNPVPQEPSKETPNGSEQISHETGTPAKKGSLHRVVQRVKDHHVVKKIVEYGKQVHAAAFRVVNHVKKKIRPTGAKSR